MRFVVKRTSTWNEDKPCEEAFRGKIPQWQTRLCTEAAEWINRTLWTYDVKQSQVCGDFWKFSTLLSHRELIELAESKGWEPKRTKAQDEAYERVKELGNITAADAPELREKKQQALWALADATPDDQKTDYTDDRQELLDLLREAREAFRWPETAWEKEMLAKIDAKVKK